MLYTMGFWKRPFVLLCILVAVFCPLVQGDRHRVAVLEERQLAEEWLENHPFIDRQRLRTHPCPCEDPSWCRPITDVPSVQDKEIFGFVLSQGEDDLSYFNFTRVTTIAWASDAIMCQAHQHHVRAIANVPSINMELILEADYRQEWVQNVTHMVQSRYFDGVTFDYESPIDDPQGPIAQAYVQLIQSTKESLSRYIHPHLQVTVCVAWSPDAIDGRNYPVQDLARVSDALYVMVRASDRTSSDHEVPILIISILC